MSLDDYTHHPRRASEPVGATQPNPRADATVADLTKREGLFAVLQPTQLSDSSLVWNVTMIRRTRVAEAKLFPADPHRSFQSHTEVELPCYDETQARNLWLQLGVSTGCYLIDESTNPKAQ